MAAKRCGLLVLLSLHKLLFFCQFCPSYGIENRNSSEEEVVDPASSQSMLFRSSFAELTESINKDHKEISVDSTDEGDSKVGSYKLSSFGLGGKAINISVQENLVNNTVHQEDSQNSSVISSDLAQSTNVKNDTVTEIVGNSTNKTAEPLWNCKKFNLTEQSVMILDNKSSFTGWLEKINKTRSCAIVLFYARWCFFSARLAPAYNAAGRAFAGIPLLALDAYTHNSLNTRYGIVGVPTILLFQESKPVARFNGTQTLKDLVEFIHQSTGMEYNTSIEVNPEDYFGPLPSIPSEEKNYYLLASLLFIICVGGNLLWRMHYVQMLWTYFPSWSAVRTVLSSAERKKDD